MATINTSVQQVAESNFKKEPLTSCTLPIGYSPSSEYFGVLCKESIIVYQFIPDHIARSAGKRSWGDRSPRYILFNEHEIKNTYENQDNDYLIYENQLVKDQSINIPNAKKTTLTTGYSSDKVRTTSKEELKKILIEQNLIPKSF